MVEVGLSDDIVPKLTVNFKAKKEPQVLDQFKPKCLMRKNHNKLYYGKYRHKTVFKLPGSLMFYPTTDEHLMKLKKNTRMT